MTSVKSLTAAAVIAAGLTPVAYASPVSAADPCVSGAEVRAQIAELVAGLTDDVRSDAARAATRKALVESLRTYRGARADTAEERRQLGLQIAALARRQSQTENRVEGRALSAAILALVEQREVGRFTAEEREELRVSLVQLRRAVVARTSNAAEGLEVAEAFKALHAQFTCRPS
jgi:plasmid stabilization system protein ParE